MPKVKTHKGAAKRFKVTASGKVKFSSKGKRHLLSCKAKDRKNALKKARYLSSEKQAKTMRRLLGE